MTRICCQLRLLTTQMLAMLEVLLCGNAQAYPAVMKIIQTLTSSISPAAMMEHIDF